MLDEGAERFVEQQVSAPKLTEPQRLVLTYLQKCNHATRNTFRHVQGREPTISLRALERLGLVTCEPSPSVMSSNVVWRITEAGMEVTV